MSTYKPGYKHAPCRHQNAEGGGEGARYLPRYARGYDRSEPVSSHRGANRLTIRPLFFLV